MTPEQEERFVAAFEQIAEAVDFIAGTIEAMELRQAREFSILYPPKRQPNDATVSHVKTEEEQLRESQGQTGEKTVGEWANLEDESTGPREAAWIQANQKRKKE